MTRIIFMFTLVALLAGCAGSPAAQTTDSTRVEAGIAVYRTNYCGLCHALEAAGTHGAFGPDHNQAALLAEERLASEHYSGTATTPAEYLRESILDPEVYITPGYVTSSHRMPAYVNLSDEDVEALVYLLLQQR